MNVGGLLLIVLYIYSIFGVQMFAMIKFNRGIDDRWNFQNFIQTFLLLLRMSTGEDWANIMASAGNSHSIVF